MNEDARKQLIQQLDTLRDQVTERLGSEPEHHAPVAAHVAQVRTLVETSPADEKHAQVAAGTLEKRLLAWEAEHPQLANLAARIARALEDAGL